MHNIAERHQDQRERGQTSGGGTIPPHPYDFGTYREHLGIWLWVLWLGSDPAEFFEVWKCGPYRNRPTLYG